MAIAKPIQGWEIDWTHPQAAGLKLCHVLNDCAGPPLDLVRSVPVTVSGNPAWTTTGELGRLNYSSVNYDAVDPTAQILGSIYPCWQAYKYASTSTLAQVLGGSGNSGTITPSMALWLNTAGPGSVGSTGAVGYFVRDSAGVVSSPFIFNAATLDGKAHVLAGVSYALNDHRLYFDGIQIAATTTAIGTLTAPLYTLGAHRRNAVTNPFLGTLYWHMAGNGAVPDMGWLASEPFAIFDSAATRRIFALGLAPTPPPTPVSVGFAGLGFPGLSGTTGGLPGSGLGPFALN